MRYDRAPDQEFDARDAAAMTAGGSAKPAGAGSWFWRVGFRVMYRGLRFLDPLIRSHIALGLPGLDGIVELRVAGRRSGRERRTLLTLLSVDGRWYVGHPNGASAWTLNAEASAAGTVTVDPPGALGDQFGLVLLPAGPERDAVIRATRTQQPFPANLVYRAAQQHIRAVGVYFRLEPAADGPEARDRA